MFGLTAEFGTQFSTLRSNARRTGVEMALTCHVAPQCHQCSGPKSELLRSEQSSNYNVARGAQSAVNPQTNAAAESIAHQGLLRLGQAEFPRCASVLNAAQWRCACSARVSGDNDVIGICFGYPRRNCSNAGFGDKLHTDAGSGIHLLQIVNELRKVLDAVDVMMRRRADQRHPELSMTQTSD